MAAAVNAVRNRKSKEALQRRTLDVFAKYDGDGSGAIDRNELREALGDLRMAVSAAQVETFISRYAQAPSTELNKEQFMRLVDDMQQFQGGAKGTPQRAVASPGPAAADGGGLGPAQRLPPAAPVKKRCAVITAWMPIWPYHQKAFRYYSNNYMQMFVAGLILGNFAVNVIEKEIDPFPADLQRYKVYWDNFDSFFNIIFAFELTLNAWSCGGPYYKFWNSGWNNFDFLVVAVGILLMIPGAIPPGSPLGNLKMLRAFRVFRLFKRIKSLNKIVTALLSAIPGVFNAFVLMLIFTMIYAILAVEYFAEVGQGCVGRIEGLPGQGPDTLCFGPNEYNKYLTFNDDGSTQSIPTDTARGFTFGKEYFGSFFRALFTLFQVMTGDSWAEVVARPLLFGLSQPDSSLHLNALFVGSYYVSFILLTQIVLTNVVVAVLLDKFVEETPKDGGEHEEEAQKMDANAFMAANFDEDVATTAPAATSLASMDLGGSSIGLVVANGGVDISSLNQAPAAPRLSKGPSATPLEAKVDTMTQLLMGMREEMGQLRAAVARCEETMSVRAVSA